MSFGDIPFASDDTTIATYARNVSELRRSIAGVVRPRAASDVARIVQIANERRLALYPISTGANWGLGSRLPVRDGAIIVDLSALNRIHDIDRVHGTAIIEPGVTQRQLHDALAKTRFRLDVTGSGADTSVLGNALDRGIAHYGSRADTTRLLEVVLGTGEIVSLEHGGGAPSIVSRLYPHGVGPALHGLFFQSSYGIVTRASVRLLPKPAALSLLSCGLPDGARLPEFVDTICALVDRGVLPPSIHLSNRERSRSVLGGALASELGRDEALALVHDLPSWSLNTALRGDPEQVRVAERLARRELSRFGRVTITRSRRLEMEERILRHLPFARRRRALVKTRRELVGHSQGIPSDVALASLAFSLDEPHEPLLDAGNAGTLFVLPLVPMNGKDVRTAVAIATEETSAHELVPYITLNASARVFEMVLNVTFRRSDPRASARAHECAARLLDRFASAGFPPYRVGVQDMARLATPTPFWDVAARLASVLDPNGVIAPGRYALG